MNEVGVNVHTIQSGMMAEHVFLIFGRLFLSIPHSPNVRLFFFLTTKMVTVNDQRTEEGNNER